MQGATPTPLSDTACKNAKPRDKAYQLSDENGLFLLVTPTGGKDELLSVGTDPDVGLKEARDRRDEYHWYKHAMERQLAYAERNAVRAAYNNAEHLLERRRMMQGWADYRDRDHTLPATPFSDIIERG